MRLKKTNGSFVVFYKDGEGKPHQRDTKQTNRKDAEDVVKQAGIAKLEKAAAVGALQESVVDTMLGRRKIASEEAIAGWDEWMGMRGRGDSTRQTYLFAVRSWLKREGLLNKPVSRIKEEHVSRAVNPKDEDSTWATRKARMAAIGSFCEYCMARRYLSEDPAHGVYIYTRDMSFLQKEGKKRVPFTEGEYNTLMEYLDEFMALPPEQQKYDVANARFWQAAVPLAYWVGLRLGDICSLEWESIGGDSLTIWTQKREFRVELPLDDSMLGDGVLRDVVNDLDLEHDKYVFPKHKALIMDPAARSAVSHDFKRWVDRAGLKRTGKSFHCLRHSCVTRLSRAGVTLKDIGQVVGHRSEATTKGYAH